MTIPNPRDRACVICGCSDDSVVGWHSTYQHGTVLGCVAALKHRNAELRRLLRIAVDAWDRVDETVAWLADDEWYGLAKELTHGKDGEA